MIERRGEEKKEKKVAGEEGNIEVNDHHKTCSSRAGYHVARRERGCEAILFYVSFANR